MIYYIALYLYIAFIFVVSMIFHELGHILYIKWILKKRVITGFNKFNFYITFRGFSSLYPIHKIGIALAGYFLGLIPILFFTGAGIYLGAFILLYSLVGCRKDLNKVGDNIGLIIRGFKYDKMD